MLQRVLQSHPEICSTAEPWLLLPLLYSIKRDGCVAEYGHSTAVDAIEDFIRELPEGESTYMSELRKFFLSIYGKQCKNGERYFLDKTPRYYLIIPEIKRLFPDAKFIFLFRNPLHALSSMINTWSSGNLKKMYAFEQDIVLGTTLLSEGYRAFQSDNVLSINYETFVENPSKSLEKLCSFLEIEFDSKMLTKFNSQESKGRMGDPTGRFEYSKIEKETIQKWRGTFNSPIKKKVAEKIIEKLAAETFSVQGYSKTEILESIRDCKTERFGVIYDLYAITLSFLIKKTKANLIFGRRRGRWYRNRLMH